MLTCDHIKASLEKHRHPENAYFMKKYMRDQYEFYGIKTPLRKQIVRDLTKAHGIADKKTTFKLSKELWSLPQREAQFVACDLLYRIIKQLTPADIPFLLDLAVRKSWWDTIDIFGPRLIGNILLRHKEEHIALSKKWIFSSNFWIQRIALLYQLKWKAETNRDHLFWLIEQVRQEEEFFIRKAIGWILREYSKTNAAAVRDFVANTELSPLSHREALKWLDR